jgi:hypothetical protein
VSSYFEVWEGDLLEAASLPMAARPAAFRRASMPVRVHRDDEAQAGLVLDEEGSWAALASALGAGWAQEDITSSTASSEDEARR